jgi:hypothetical protein
MIPAFERAKTVHALGRAATVIGEINGVYAGKLEGIAHGNRVARKTLNIAAN